MPVSGKKDTWDRYLLLSQNLHVKLKRHIVTLVVIAFYRHVNRIPVLTLKLLDIGLPVTTHKGSVNVDPGAKEKSRRRYKVLNAEIFHPEVGRRSHSKGIVDIGNRTNREWAGIQKQRTNQDAGKQCGRIQRILRGGQSSGHMYSGGQDTGDVEWSSINVGTGNKRGTNYKPGSLQESIQSRL